MKVKALVCISSAAHTINVGDEVEMEDAEAIRHIEAGHVIPATRAKIERAVKSEAATEKREGVVARVKKALVG